MTIEKPNEFGMLGSIEIDDFEKANKMKLPLDYRSFLLSFNGGTPDLRHNAQPDTDIEYIFGMHNGPYHASLYKKIDMYSDRLPLSTFPIASDPFGNLFIMSLHSENLGHIYFWDQEGEPEHQDGHYVDNCYFVASSFNEFIGNLK